MTQTDFLDKNFSTAFLCVSSSADSVRQAAHFVCRKGMRLFSRLFYVRGGTTTFIVNGRRIVAGKGDIVYLPRDVEYESFWESREEINYVSVLFQTFDSAGKLFDFSETLCVMTHDAWGLHLKNFEAMREIYRGGQKGCKFRCQSILWKVLYDVLSDWHSSRLNGKDAIYRGVWTIEDNYQSDIDINSVAASCGLCPSYFRKKFREVTGMTPVEYKNYMKTKRAIELLSSGEFNVTEAAEMVGFSDVFYFCKQFKRFWGVSPKKYIAQTASEPAEE